jgi:hypothetical protein
MNPCQKDESVVGQIKKHMKAKWFEMFMTKMTKNSIGDNIFLY